MMYLQLTSWTSLVFYSVILYFIFIGSGFLKFPGSNGHGAGSSSSELIELFFMHVYGVPSLDARDETLFSLVQMFTAEMVPLWVALFQ